MFLCLSGQCVPAVRLTMCKKVVLTKDSKTNVLLLVKPQLDTTNTTANAQLTTAVHICCVRGEITGQQSQFVFLSVLLEDKQKKITNVNAAVNVFCTP